MVDSIFPISCWARSIDNDGIVLERRRTRTVTGKVVEEGVGNPKIGSRARPKHILQELSVRNDKERSEDMEAGKSKSDEIHRYQ